MTDTDALRLFSWVWNHPPLVVSDGVAQHLLSVPLAALPLDRCADAFRGLRAQHPQLQKPGIEFEEALCALLMHHPHVTGLRRGIVLPHQSGQLDFVFGLTTAPGVFHLEVALKFYCCVSASGSTREDDFVGPHRKDSLARKLTKLRDRQLPVFLGDSAMVLAPGTPRTSMMLVQGALHVQHPAAPTLAMPDAIHRDHQSGVWVHLRDTDAWLSTWPSDARFVHLNDHAKLLRTRSANDVWQSKDELRASIRDIVVGSHYLAIDADNGSRCWILPDDWTPTLLDAKSRRT